MSDNQTSKQAKDEAAVLAKIAEWPDPYAAIGARLHALILHTNPDLHARLWYGMPGYAKDGPVLCFFRVDDYMTFGLTEKATFTLDEDAPHQLMPASWFFTELDAATEVQIAAIVREATR